MKKIVPILMLLLLFGCRTYVDETTPAKFVPRFPDGSTPPGFEFEGNTITYKIFDSTVKIRHMESSDVDLFFLKHDLPNPFIGNDPFRNYLALFLLTFVNKENGMIRFDPRMASLYIGGRYYRGSLDYTEVAVAFEELNPVSDSSVFKKTMYDLELDIRPGSSVEGLMVFPFIPKGSKKIVLMLSGIFIGDRTFTIPFEFEEK